jgi:LPXTG-motif cell wall-anchored protein
VQEILQNEHLRVSVRSVTGTAPNDWCDTRRVRSRRVMTTWLPAVALSVTLGIAPATALATGPSAGDNQYTDPLAGQNGHTTSTTHHTTPPPKTTSSPASTPPPAQTTTSPEAPAAPTTSATTTSSSSASTSSTTASTAATSKAKADPKTLPMTGYDSALGAALGAVLLGAGLLVRRRVTT